MAEKTILKLDASLLRESSCDYRWVMLGIEGWQTPMPFNDTQYGSAGHKFIYTMYMTGGSFVDSMKAAYEVFDKPCIIKPDKRHLTKVHLSKTCLDFWQNFESKSDFEVLVIDGKPAVEINFAIKVYEDDLVIVLVCGTIDKLGQIRNGAYCFGDNKFTSSWDIAKYFRQYQLSNQLRLYHWAIKRMAKDNPNSPFAKIAATPFGAFIDGIFMSSNKDTRFERSSMMFYKPEEAVEFEYYLDKKIQEFINLYFNTKIKTRSGSLGIEQAPRQGIVEGLCHNGYGPCRYFDICAAPDRVAAEHILKRDFIQKPYDPLAFGKD